MNAGGPWKHLNEVYIGHDITEQQALVLIEVFKENGYKISPEVYDEKKRASVSKNCLNFK